jgi:hypothetical protein
MGYGENQEFNALQGAAPLAATPPASNARARNMSPAGSSGVAAVPLFSPTGFPEEPITAGASFGPGDGPGSPMRPIMMSSGSPDMLESLAKVASYDRTGRIASIVQYLSMNR